MLAPHHFFRMAPDMSKVKENEGTSADVDYAIAALFPKFEQEITFKPVAVTCAAALFMLINS